MWSLICALECESVVSAAVESQESFFLKVSLPCQAVVSTHLLFTSEPHVRPTLGHFHLWTWGISWKRSEGKEVLNETEGTAKGSLWVTGIQTKDQSKKNKSLYFCWLFFLFFLENSYEVKRHEDWCVSHIFAASKTIQQKHTDSVYCWTKAILENTV